MPLDRVFSSELPRALETAAIVAARRIGDTATLADDDADLLINRLRYPGYFLLIMAVILPELVRAFDGRFAVNVRGHQVCEYRGQTGHASEFNPSVSFCGRDGRHSESARPGTVSTSLD